MELQSGMALLSQQFKALFLKNLLVSWRSKGATFVQLFSSLFFMFLLFVIQKAIESRYSSSTSFTDVFDPTPLVFPPIPPCEEKYFVKLPCFDFVWSGNDSRRIREIVDRILVNNPGRPIPSTKIQSFRTQSEADNWLLNNPMQCSGALHFWERNSTMISYGIQTNSTFIAKRGSFEDPTFKFQIPLQLAAEREIGRSLIRDPKFSWTVSLKEFAHPGNKIFSAVSTAGPIFFLAISMFGFVFQISALIAEKELKLRQAMTMMGLYDSAYWLSWFTWEGILTLLSALFTVLFGMMFQFDFFLLNSFAVLFVLFYLFQLNMIGFAFMLSAFISKASSSTTVGFSVFTIGFLTQIVTVFGFPYTKKFSNTFRIIWSIFPPNVFAQGLQLLSDATSTPQDHGVSWNRRAKCTPNDTECLITINDIYVWLVSTFSVWLILAIYFDNILPNVSGVRKSVLYFLMPGYWMGRGGNKAEEGGICSCRGSIPPLESFTLDDEDVLEEENIVKQKMDESVLDASVVVQIRGLVKIFPGRTKISCCKCERTSPYHALKGMWVNIAKDQLFCLLGPNGAGKTTAINCLTGITPVTSGDGLHCQFFFETSTMSETETSEIHSNTKSEETSNIPQTGDLQSIQAAYRLNGKNYLKWSQFVQTFLKGKGKISHLLGTGPKKGDPKFAAWDEEDSMVMSWLWNFMLPEISDTCMFLSTAQDIWTTIRQTYSKAGDAALIYEIKTKISATKQGNLSVTQYANLLQNLWQELDQYRCVQMVCSEDAATLKNFIEKDRVYDFLAGLNVEFDQVRIQILGKERLSSLNETISLIRAEENRREVMLEPKTLEGSAMISTKSNKDTIWCTYCKKSRHTRDDCFKLHGKEQVLSRKGGFKGGKVHLTAGEDQTQEKSNQAGMGEFKKEEIEKLRNLLNSLEKSSSTCSLAQSGFGYGEDDWTC